MSPSLVCDDRAQLHQIDQRLPRQLAAGHRLLLQPLETQIIERPFSSASLPLYFNALATVGRSRAYS